MSALCFQCRTHENKNDTHSSELATMLFSSLSLECGVTSKQLDLGVPSVCVCTALKFCHMEILFVSGWSQEEGGVVAGMRKCVFVIGQMPQPCH